MKTGAALAVDPDAANEPAFGAYSNDERVAWRAGAARAFSLVAIGLCTGLVLCRVTLDVGMSCAYMVRARTSVGWNASCWNASC
jgi:hypothetical protein